MEEFLELLA